MTKFRFTFDPQFQGDAEPFVGDAVNSLEEAEGQMNLIANYTLLLHREALMHDYSNYGFLEKREPDGLWQIIEEDAL